MLVTGGNSLGPEILATAEINNSIAGTWSAAASMSHGHADHTATLLRTGEVLVTGGNSPNNDLTVCEVYDPTLQSWSDTGSLTQGRWLHTATLLRNGKVLVAGGRNATGISVSSAELYERESGVNEA